MARRQPADAGSRISGGLRCDRLRYRPMRRESVTIRAAARDASAKRAPCSRRRGPRVSHRLARAASGGNSADGPKVPRAGKPGPCAARRRRAAELAEGRTQGRRQREGRRGEEGAECVFVRACVCARAGGWQPAMRVRLRCVQWMLVGGRWRMMERWGMEGAGGSRCGGWWTEGAGAVWKLASRCGGRDERYGTREAFW